MGHTGQPSTKADQGGQRLPKGEKKEQTAAKPAAEPGGNVKPQPAKPSKKS